MDNSFLRCEYFCIEMHVTTQESIVGQIKEPENHK